MGVTVLAFVWSPSLVGHLGIEYLPVPDHVAYSEIEKCQLLKEITIHAVFWIVSKVERIPVIVVAFPFLMGCITHQSICRAIPVGA